MKLSATVAGTRPALTISRMSPVSSVSSAGTIFTGGFPSLCEAGVEGAKVLGVAARRADVELPPRQLVEARRGRHVGAGDEDLRDAGGDRLREVHLLLPLGRDRELRGGDVAPSVEEPRDQLVAGDGHGDHVDGDQLVAELLVELLLERLDQLVRHAHLAAPVHEVEHRVLDGEDADHAPLHHAVEVALEGLDEGREAGRERGRLRGGLEGLLGGRGRLGHGGRGGAGGRGRPGAAATAEREEGQGERGERQPQGERGGADRSHHVFILSHLTASIPPRGG